MHVGEVHAGALRQGLLGVAQVLSSCSDVLAEPDGLGELVGGSTHVGSE